MYDLQGTYLPRRVSPSDAAKTGQHTLPNCDDLKCRSRNEANQKFLKQELHLLYGSDYVLSFRYRVFVITPGSLSCLSNPKPGHITDGSKEERRMAGRRGGTDGQDGTPTRTGQDGGARRDGSVRPGDNRPSYPPDDRKHPPGRVPGSTNKGNPM